MIKTRLTVAALLIVLAPSCAQRLTKKNMSQLNSLSIPAATQHAKAYQDPQSMTAGSAGALGFASGLTLGLAGIVVAGAGAAIKQASFEGKYKSEVEAIKGETPKDVGPMVTTELQTQLSSDPFFGPALKAGGNGGKIELEVRVLTLTKNTDKTHTPAISVMGKVAGPTGNRLLPLMAFGNGEKLPGCRASLKTYATTPGLLRAHYQQVAKVTATALADLLKKQAAQAK